MNIVGHECHCEICGKNLNDRIKVLEKELESERISVNELSLHCQELKEENKELFEIRELHYNRIKVLEDALREIVSRGIVFDHKGKYQQWLIESCLKALDPET